MLLLYCYVNSLGNGASCQAKLTRLFRQGATLFLQAKIASEQKDFHLFFVLN